MAQLRPTDIYKADGNRELWFFAKNAQGMYLRPEERAQWVTAIVEEYQNGRLVRTDLIIRKPETTPPII